MGGSSPFAFHPSLFTFHHFYGMTRLLSFLLLLLGAVACKPTTQFKLLTPDESGITFSNALDIRDSLNILDNELIYNGAGVAVADWNGDGLTDIFFTANMADNALYLNKGNRDGGRLQFEDVTKTAGVSKPKPAWSAGATVVDINADGKLDLYVSNMLYGQAELRRNWLFVNQGNDTNNVPVFKEQAADYGLDSDTYTAQTTFFDYDNDGDLDAYLLVNQMDMQFANQYFSKALRDASPTHDRLLRNDYDPKRGHAYFTDVTDAAGIRAQGYGHGVSVMDINQDGWQDLYVTNDYLSMDNLFINAIPAPKATGQPLPFFTDHAHECLKHQSWSAMGNDVADINNDGLLDLVAMDMLPDANERKKALIRENSYAHYQFTKQYGYDYQHIRNTLQLNRGLDPQTGLPCFSDVSMMAGISETDWSWCPLWFDADNDGYRDLLITNGFPKDITDQDFLAYRKDVTGVSTSKGDLYKLIPEVKLHNYAFRNQLGNVPDSAANRLAFADKTTDWGFDVPTFSNGAAYADFDNDGDIDVVINNTNDYAHLYENHLNDNADSRPNYLRIKLAGPRLNPMGIGAKVTVYAGGQRFYAEQNITRGYLSTSEATLHVGLGTSIPVTLAKIDSVQIVWPMGTSEAGGTVAGTCRVQIIKQPTANQTLTIDWQKAQVRPYTPPVVARQTALTAIDPQALGITYTHSEAETIDFNSQKTLPHKFSSFGPVITTGDINGDGLTDAFVGGSAYTEGTFLVQQPGRFSTVKPSFKQSGNKAEQDAGVLLFDADGDGDNDLYCVRGGYLVDKNAPLLQDALYLNDGRGNYKRDSLALPRETASGRVVRAADFDKDGDLDLFVGGTATPRTYPKADRSFLLRNDSQKGRARFTDVTAQLAPTLLEAGIVNDAQWADMDGDTYPDLLLAAEWKPIMIWRGVRSEGRGANKTSAHVLHPSPLIPHPSPGWWASLCVADFDKDGDLDIVAGNYGLNTAYHASEAEPLTVHHADFDNNGTYDAILTQYDNNRDGKRAAYVYHTRDDLIKQVIAYRRRYLKYEDFGKATAAEMITDEDRKKATTEQVTQLASCYFENLGTSGFRMRPLPMEAQYAPIMTLTATDVNRDGWPDLVMAGNDFGMEVFQGRADAGYGLVLLNTGPKRSGTLPFRALSPAESGFIVPGDARGMATLPLPDGRKLLMVSQKQEPLRLYTLKN
jgi:enediyne biosynthesis protein E4